MTGPVVRPRFRESFARQGLMSHLGARLIRASDGECVIEADYAPRLSQHHGAFHAGVTSALADTAGGYAAMTLMPDNASVVTAEFKISLTAPARGERLRAIATVVRSGRTLTTVRATVEVLREGSWHRCAEFLGTMFALTETPETELPHREME